MTWNYEQKIKEDEWNCVIRRIRNQTWTYSLNGKPSFSSIVELICPICSKISSSFVYGHFNCSNNKFYINKTKLDEETGKLFYRTLYIHLRNQILLSGSREHMFLLLKMFGKEKGLAILEEIVKHSIFVATKINYLLKQIQNEYNS